MKKMSEASDEQVAALESTQQMFEDLKGALDSCMASIQTITGKSRMSILSVSLSQRVSIP